MVSTSTGAGGRRAADPRRRGARDARIFSFRRTFFLRDGRKATKTLLRLPAQTGGQLTEGDLMARYPELKAWLAGSAR